MPTFKKTLIIIIILLLVLMIAILSVVNSSYFIAKVADEYAPDYNITYDNISGNIFTGIQVKNLKYANQTISNSIVYKWNPLTLLQKKITIDEIKIEKANIDVIKVLIASFDADESDDKTSGSFDFDVSVDNIDISIDPFTQEGIAVNKTVLTADDVFYHSDGMIDVDNLFFDVDSNLTQFSFKGSMNDREILVESLDINTLDSEMLEALIAYFTQSNTAQSNNQTKSDETESENFFIPTNVKVEHFSGSILAREYMSIDIKKFKVILNDLELDITKVFENKRDMLNVENVALQLDTNITSIDMNASLKHEKVQFEHIRLKDIDTLALQNLFMNKSSESEGKSAKHQKDEANIWIPKHISIKNIQADFMPVTYTPVEVEGVSIRGQEIGFDMGTLIVDKGYLELNGTSNLSDIKFLGNVQENKLEGKVSLSPSTELFELYDLPLRKEAIGAIVVGLNASKEYIVADVKAEAKQVLKAKNDAFNIDIDRLNSHVVYNVETNALKVESRAKVSTPYAKNISLSNTFVMDEIMHYEGVLKAATLTGLEEKMIEPLKNLDIHYKGDAKSIHAEISSKQIKGSFNSDDMKKGRLLLETSEALKLNKFITLPSELNATKANVNIDFPINFEQLDSLKGKVKITSNAVNIDADIIFDETLKIEAKTDMPEKSLLKSLNKEVQWNALTPMNIKVSMTPKENLLVNIKSKSVNANVKYHLENHKLNGKMAVEGLSTTIQGDVDKNIKIISKVSSIKSLKKGISALYKLDDFPPLEGSALLTTTVTNLKRVDFTLSSPKIIYKVDRKTKHIIDDFKATAFIEDSKLELNSYNLTYNKQKFFSTKPSRVNIDEEFITLESIWLNDALDVTGKYNKIINKGTIYGKAENFPIEHKYANINAKMDMETKLDGNKTSIEGNITLLSGKIKYNISQKTFASDEDIIFVEEMKKKSDSLFMKNLSTNIQLNTREPLVLQQGAINIKLKPELGINKVENGDLMVLGSVEIVKGGTYMFEGKKFVLSKSAIHFTGNPNKPLLDIKVKYRALNHMITIFVSGSADAPLIDFSSNPSLSKEQILSLILFDTEVGGDAHSGDEMMKMMGGAMAKSALSDLGVKLDHLVLGEGNSIEVGKKLTNKITIIYVDGEVSRVKLKYRHGQRTESVIQMSEESQSYDIIFKDDF